MLVHDLVSAIKDSFIHIKEFKTLLLRNYVNHCAIKIQKNFKGFFARKYTVKIKKAFKTADKHLSSIVRGWRVRKIMKTKEIENFTHQLTDYEKAREGLEREE